MLFVCRISYFWNSQLSFPYGIVFDDIKGQKMCKAEPNWEMLCFISICLIVSVLSTHKKTAPDFRPTIKTAQRTVTRVLSVRNGGRRGTWSRPEFCARRYHASGFSLKIQPKQGSGDDTALNAIRLKCRRGTRAPNTGGSIMAKEGPWGRWTSALNCQSGKRLVRFRLQVQPKQGTGDDTMATYVRFKCRQINGGTHSDLGKSGSRGKFGAWSKTCPQRSAICGMTVRMAPRQGVGDDTALNDVRFYCCK
ncbi:Vitelline membrane outer layer protein 1,Vitelline membrane outer layer protein 1 homolog [Mytilus coruscus]|uniref:Vitelline membrane outer layer protein 1,Vitelline membrane outer layer protein 1 homolog n=1 Tax=Mytilus coruscus TaxID=42192 RepID=A0A6J8BIU0_MYTCO|nr:Vitelline membrane outer layer protein 1,Vitelline membrane outer layer protein 1 homolog [Mytilus coruscus]